VLTEDVTSFIHSYVKSIWALQLLLILHRRRERPWTVSELNRELRGSLQLVSDILQEFERAHFVERFETEFYRWRATPEVDELVARLETAHQVHPLSVVNAIYAPAQEPIRTLADAFRLKKD